MNDGHKIALGVLTGKSPIEAYHDWLIEQDRIPAETPVVFEHNATLIRISTSTVRRALDKTVLVSIATQVHREYRELIECINYQMMDTITVKFGEYQLQMYGEVTLFELKLPAFKMVSSESSTQIQPIEKIQPKSNESLMITWRFEASKDTTKLHRIKPNLRLPIHLESLDALKSLFNLAFDTRSRQFELSVLSDKIYRLWTTVNNTSRSSAIHYGGSLEECVYKSVYQESVSEHR